MQLTLVNPPIMTLLSVAEVAAFLRIELDMTDGSPPLIDDSRADDIAALISAAVAHLDGRDGTLGRCLAPQTWRLDLARFPSGPIVLPLPPTMNVLGVEYVDTNGIAQQLIGYRLHMGGLYGASIQPGLGTAWPATLRDTLDAVRVTFEAGYVTASSPAMLALPEPIRQALKLIIQQWYDEGSFIVGGQVTHLPFAVDALLAPYRCNLIA